MRYVGGKSRIAKKLAKVMLDYTDERAIYLEPFLGGAAVAKEMGNNFMFTHYNDLHSDLSAMWSGLIEETFEMPDEVSEEDYKSLKNQEPSALRGFAGFAASFGGKWFGGYARGKNIKGEPRNYVKESKTNIEKCLEGMRGKFFTYIYNYSYESFDPVSGTVVYCDPPYAETTGYSTGGFDHKTFWATMEQWSKNGAIVFVSEYSAPEGWEAIWEVELKSQLKLVEQGRHMTTEKLFVWKGNK